MAFHTSVMCVGNRLTFIDRYAQVQFMFWVRINMVNSFCIEFLCHLRLLWMIRTRYPININNFLRIWLAKFHVIFFCCKNFSNAHIIFAFDKHFIFLFVYDSKKDRFWAILHIFMDKMLLKIVRFCNPNIRNQLRKYVSPKLSTSSEGHSPNYSKEKTSSWTKTICKFLLIGSLRYNL